MKLTKPRIRWISENEDRNDPTVRGYWASSDGRFSIAPNYRHTIYPAGYTVTDKLTRKTSSNDTVRDCKAWAQRITDKPACCICGKPVATAAGPANEPICAECNAEMTVTS